jgi:phosphoglycerate kinase
MQFGFFLAGRRYFDFFSVSLHARLNNIETDYISNINISFMQTIEQYSFAGKKAFVRVDFNVPLDENFNITDDTRIRAALPTLKKILTDGGSVIIGSHLGRPKGVTDKYSLKHILSHVSKLLGVNVTFASDCASDEASQKAAALKPGEALLLENLRFYAEEEGKPRGLAEDATDEEKAAAKKTVKASQKEFTKKLASYADAYVNDAFGTAHRAHASTALMAEYFDENSKMFGYLMEKEVIAVEKILNDINRPFTAIMGGSKVSSKIDIIENLLGKVDNLIITGGMTYTFTKAQGGKIGKSICEDDKLDLALELIQRAKEKGVNLVLATDAKIADEFDNNANTKFSPVNEIPDEWEGLDIGPETEKLYADVIKQSKTILWNGPTGVFEFDNFAHGSLSVAEAIAEATKAGAFSLIGGGDSVACVNKFGLADAVSYVSTGGGALLEAIEGKILPGIAAIKK